MSVCIGSQYLLGMLNQQLQIVIHSKSKGHSKDELYPESNHCDALVNGKHQETS